MCGICGCAEIDNVDERVHRHEHVHGDHEHVHGEHEHEHEHQHAAVPGPGRLLRMEQAVLAKNERFAERNRGFFQVRRILALNLMSSPGAGKTTLLERTIRDLSAEVALSVIEGDQESENDAQRIRATGCSAVQINTGAGCHLDAERVGRALQQLDPEIRSLVFLENVGNLVCPALFDLGERAKVVVLSVTEGEDKPTKYPHMFRAADVMVLSKTDLLPHLEFDLELCLANARRVNPRLRIFPVSVRNGAGLGALYCWFREQLAQLNNEATMSPEHLLRPRQGATS